MGHTYVGPMHSTDTNSPIYVVPCCGDKLNYAAPAAELYTGSMFRFTYAVACEMAAADGGRVLILSAEHGLVDPTTVLAPYDTRMGRRGCVTTEDIAATAKAQGIDYGSEVFALLPRDYFKALSAALDLLDVYPQDVYEAAPGIGYQRGTNSSVRRFYAA